MLPTDEFSIFASKVSTATTADDEARLKLNGVTNGARHQRDSPGENGTQSFQSAIRKKKSYEFPLPPQKNF